MAGAENSAGEVAAVASMQERMKRGDERLQSKIVNEYQYMSKYIDPILEKLVQETLLARPRNTAQFMLDLVMDPGSVPTVPSGDYLPDDEPSAYLATNVTPVLGMLMEQFVQQKPLDTREFIISFLKSLL